VEAVYSEAVGEAFASAASADDAGETKGQGANPSGGRPLFFAQPQPKVVYQPHEEPEQKAATLRAEAAPGSEAKPLPVRALIGEIILPAAATSLDQVLLLNQKHAVIGNYGGRCAVLSWERWSIDQEVMTPTFQTFGDLETAT
jgi:hypothetical protein